MCVSSKSYLHILPDVQAQNPQVLLDSSQHSSGSVSYSGSCHRNSSLVPWPLRTHPWPALLEHHSCGLDGLPASTPRPPPTNQPSHCRAAF